MYAVLFLAEGRDSDHLRGVRSRSRFCSKNQTQENDDGARERMGAHILENVVIRTWRIRATTPQENRSGRCNKRKQSDEHVTVFLIEKITKKKEKRRKWFQTSPRSSREIVQPSSEMESDSALLESETQNISNANGGVDEDSQVILMKAEKVMIRERSIIIDNAVVPITTTQNGSVRLRLWKSFVRMGDWMSSTMP